MKIIFKWILFKMSKRVFYISGHLLLKFGNSFLIWNIDPEFVQMGMPCFDPHANSLASESAIIQDEKAFLAKCESLRPRNSAPWCLWTSRAPHVLPESHRGKEKTIKMEWDIRKDFPGGSVGKESACNTGDASSILGREDPLEDGRANQSSILAWRIPWTEEPGGLQAIGSQRIRHS